MSPYFIKLFKKTHKCPYCKNLTSRSLCAVHLKKAREHWIKWSHFRRDKGICSYCDRKTVNGWIRCRPHTLYNRAKCKAWMKKFGKKRYYERKRLGICVKSLSHGKAIEPHVYCEKCLGR